MAKAKQCMMPEKDYDFNTINVKTGNLIRKTDETTIKFEQELMQEFKGLPYYISPIVQGTTYSISVTCDDSFHVFDRYSEYQDDGKLDFYEYVKEHNLKEKLEDVLDGENDILSDEGYQLQSITVKGKWCVKNNNSSHPDKPRWFIFAVSYDDDGQNLQIIKNIADMLGVDIVPVEEIGNDLLSKYPDVSALLKRADKSYKQDSLVQCEGIIIRPVEPVYSEIIRGPLSIKVINDKHL